MTDELLQHVRNGRWGEALAVYPGPKAVADDGRLEPLEAVALLALDDARRAGRRAWLIDKYDEAAWEDAGAPVDTDHDALEVLCGGLGPAAFLAAMGPGQLPGVGATGGDVVVFAL
jgi:hypothetical protein